MRKILLAINGVKPNRKVFSYAVQLCKRLKAELIVLQVVDPRGDGDKGRMGLIARKTRQARKILESSLTAATFAEAGEHEIAREMMIQARKQIHDLLPETAKAGIQCHFTMKAGPPDREIIRYSRRHRDIVLTVYDGSESDSQGGKGTSGGKDVAGIIRQKLTVPVVTRHA
jgi:nucleotide-binding universal stress UspA family protein